MFITRKYISRRTFLRGSVGVTLALPFLDAMVPAQTPLAKTAARPWASTRIICLSHRYSRLVIRSAWALMANTSARR